MKQGTRYRQLSYEERVIIASLRKKGESIRTIASHLGRSANTVAREIREKKVNGIYTAKTAHHKTYWKRYCSKQGCMKVVQDPRLSRLVQDTLPLGWSPERIARYATR